MLKLGSRPFAAPALLILIALLVAALVPGNEASAGSQVRPKRYVTGWLPYWSPMPRPSRCRRTPRSLRTRRPSSSTP